MLEVGCGEGRVTQFLARKSKKFTAIDADKKSIKIAKSKITGADISVGSGENMGFERESFDTLIFTYSLHHQNSRNALKETRRVLKTKGQLVVIEPAQDGEVMQFLSPWLEKRCNTLPRRRSTRYAYASM